MAVGGPVRPPLEGSEVSKGLEGSGSWSPKPPPLPAWPLPSLGVPACPPDHVATWSYSSAACSPHPEASPLRLRLKRSLCPSKSH